MRSSDNSIVTILILVAIIAVLGVLFALRIMNTGNTNLNGVSVQNSLENQGGQTSGDTGKENSHNGEKQINNESQQAFNSKFARYIGQKRRGAAVKTLIDEVNKNNETYKDKNVTIECDGVNYTNSLEELSNSIAITDQYDVEIGYDSQGYINKITISK